MDSVEDSLADVDLMSLPSPVMVQPEEDEVSVDNTTQDVNEQPIIGNIMDNQVPDVPTSSLDLKQVMSPRAPEEGALRKPLQRVVNNSAVCWKCEAAIEEAAKHCDECGTSQSKKKCLECGTENRPSAKFCRDCGKPCGPKMMDLTPNGSRTPAGFMTPNKDDRKVPPLPKLQAQSEYGEEYGVDYENYYPSQEEIIEDIKARSDLVDKGTSEQKDGGESGFGVKPNLQDDSNPFMALLAKNMDAQSERQTELMQVLKEGMVKKTR
jgi:ribosomal protein L40E